MTQTVQPAFKNKQPSSVFNTIGVNQGKNLPRQLQMKTAKKTNNLPAIIQGYSPSLILDLYNIYYYENEIRSCLSIIESHKNN